MILIGIPYPDERMIKSNPEIIESIQQYNTIYEECSQKMGSISIIHPLVANNYEYEIFEDGYHPNPKGNELVLSELRKQIENV